MALLLPFPTFVDSTMRSDWAACERQFFLAWIRRLRLRGENIHLKAGGAFAKGLEVTRILFYGEGLDADLAIGYGIFAACTEWGKDFDPHEDDQKGLTRVMYALLEYFDTFWPLDRDTFKPYMLANGKPAVEVNGAIPLHINHPVTGNPMLYVFRTDMVAESGGVLFGVDEKTTKQLGPTWGNKWTLRAQFTGYVWGIQHTANLPVAGMVIRGISFLKESYGNAEAIVYRPDWQINRWLTQLHYDVDRMIKAWKAGYYCYNLDEACAAYGGCQFLRVCDQEHPEPFIDLYYEHNGWNPMTRKDDIAAIKEAA